MDKSLFEEEAVFISAGGDEKEVDEDVLSFNDDEEVVVGEEDEEDDEAVFVEDEKHEEAEVVAEAEVEPEAEAEEIEIEFEEKAAVEESVAVAEDLVKPASTTEKFVHVDAVIENIAILSPSENPRQQCMKLLEAQDVPSIRRLSPLGFLTVFLAVSCGILTVSRVRDMTQESLPTSTTTAVATTKFKASITLTPMKPAPISKSAVVANTSAIAMTKRHPPKTNISLARRIPRKSKSTQVVTYSRTTKKVNLSVTAGGTSRSSSMKGGPYRRPTCGRCSCEQQGDCAVVLLTEHNFDDFRHKNLMVLFHSSKKWNELSHGMLKIWNDLAKAAVDLEIKHAYYEENKRNNNTTATALALARLPLSASQRRRLYHQRRLPVVPTAIAIADCSTEKRLCKRWNQGLTSFPTVAWMEQGRMVFMSSKFSTQPSLEGLLSFFYYHQRHFMQEYNENDSIKQEERKQKPLHQTQPSSELMGTSSGSHSLSEKKDKTTGAGRRHNSSRQPMPPPSTMKPLTPALMGNHVVNRRDIKTKAVTPPEVIPRPYSSPATQPWNIKLTPRKITGAGSSTVPMASKTMKNVALVPRPQSHGQVSSSTSSLMGTTNGIPHVVVKNKNTDADPRLHPSRAAPPRRRPQTTIKRIRRTSMTTSSQVVLRPDGQIGHYQYRQAKTQNAFNYTSVSPDVMGAKAAHHRNATASGQVSIMTINKTPIPNEDSDTGKYRSLRLERYKERVEDLDWTNSNVLFLTPSTFWQEIRRHTLVFVDYFVWWCRYTCQHPTPTWNKFAGNVTQEGLPVTVAAIDCSAHRDFCLEQGVDRFPRHRWYQNGKAIGPDYRAKRNVEGFFAFTKEKLSLFGMKR